MEVITNLFNFIVFLALINGIRVLFFKGKRKEDEERKKTNNNPSNEWDNLFKEL